MGVEAGGHSNSQGTGGQSSGEPSGPLASCGHLLGSVTSGDRKHGSRLAAPSEVGQELRSPALPTMKTFDVSFILMDVRPEPHHKHNHPTPTFSPTKDHKAHHPHAAHSSPRRDLAPQSSPSHTITQAFAFSKNQFGGITHMQLGAFRVARL